MKSKKAQIQLMESTISLFIFFIMLMIGLSIYSNFQASRYDRMQSLFNDQKAIEVSRRITSLIELQCSNQGDVTKDCIEIQKLDGFNITLNQFPRYFREEFGTTKVRINWVYPSELSQGMLPPTFFNNNNNLEKERTLFDFSSGLENKRTFYYPITLWDKRFIPERNYFGWLIIEAYS